MAKAFMKVLLVSIVVAFSSGTCLFGTYNDIPGTSCLNIIETQPDCFGENGDYYIQKDDDSPVETVYCDMTYKDGGWRRIFNYHSNTVNTTVSCPYNFTEALFFGNTHKYCWKGTEDYVMFTWNSNEDVYFNEIRGYVTLRARTNGVLDAFDEDQNRPIESGTLDGIEIQSGTYPGGLLRSYFSYVVGTKTTGPCPINGGSDNGVNRLDYRDGAWACDEMDPTGTKDSEGFLNQELFEPTTCVQCPPGVPWFERRFVDTMHERKVNIRMVNADDDVNEQLYLTDVELYVR